MAREISFAHRQKTYSESVEKARVAKKKEEKKIEKCLPNPEINKVFVGPN